MGVGTGDRLSSRSPRSILTDASSSGAVAVSDACRANAPEASASQSSTAGMADAADGSRLSSTSSTSSGSTGWSGRAHLVVHPLPYDPSTRLEEHVASTASAGNGGSNADLQRTRGGGGSGGAGGVAGSRLRSREAWGEPSAASPVPGPGEAVLAICRDSAELEDECASLKAHRRARKEPRRRAGGTAPAPGPILEAFEGATQPGVPRLAEGQGAKGAAIPPALPPRPAAAGDGAGPPALPPRVRTSLGAAASLPVLPPKPIASTLEAVGWRGNSTFDSPESPRSTPSGKGSPEGNANSGNSGDLTPGAGIDSAQVRNLALLCAHRRTSSLSCPCQKLAI